MQSVSQGPKLDFGFKRVCNRPSVNVPALSEQFEFQPVSENDVANVILNLLLIKHLASFYQLLCK